MDNEASAVQPELAWCAGFHLRWHGKASERVS